MKALALVAIALFMVGCEDRYRYPCQDSANKDNPECNRPACEIDGLCYDTLNGLSPQQTRVEESSAEQADCNCEF